jgi:predicted DNA-binding transcriptional regulator YafY
MRLEILLSMAFELLEKRQLTSSYLAEKFSVSPRTVYRCVETLSKFMPLHIKRGRSGGICLADNYILPSGFMTEVEYRAVTDALEKAYAQTGEYRFLSAKRKFSAQAKREELPSYISAEIGEITLLPEKNISQEYDFLRILQESIREKRVTELLLKGEKFPRKTEPASLLLKNNEWHLVTFCYLERAFLTIPIRSLRGAWMTEEVFHPRSLRYALPMYASNGGK